MARRIAPRLDEWIEEQLAALVPYGEVVDAAVTRYGCDERTAERAIKRVRDRWSHIEVESIADRRARFRAEARYAWRKALEAEDYRAVAMIARVLADVEGIRSPKQVEHAGTVGLRPVAAMSPQERMREIDLLLAKRQAALATGIVPLLAAGAGHAEDGEDELGASLLPPDIRPAKRKQRRPSGKRASRSGKPRIH